MGLSQEALALMTELDRSYVSGIERGEHNLSFMSLNKLCCALGTTSSELLRSASL